MKQLFSLSLTAVFAAVLLIGCSDGSTLVETDQGAGAEDSEFAALGKGAPAHFVSAGGHDQEGLADANYSFVAREDAEGNVSGQLSDIFKIDGVAIGAVHGSVDCLVVDGNQAVVGGVITKGTDVIGGRYVAGNRFLVSVKDEGTSANDAPDLITGVFEDASPEFVCAAFAPAAFVPFLNPAVGQVIVR